MDSITDFLYARPSFFEGVARILDFGNTLAEYNRALTGARADRFALASDWATIGQDLRSARSAYARELEAQRHALEEGQRENTAANADATGRYSAAGSPSSPAANRAAATDTPAVPPPRRAAAASGHSGALRHH